MTSRELSTAITAFVLLASACSSSSTDEPPAEARGRQSPSPARTASPAVELLEEIESSAVGLSVAADGQPWGIEFPRPGSLDFFSYNPRSGEIERFAVPQRIPQFYGSVVRIDDRGHVILGQGTTVIDFDPASGVKRNFDIQETVSALETSGSLAYVASRELRELRELIELDLASGQMRRLSLDTFCGIEDIAVASGAIWLTSGYFDDCSSATTTGWLDLETETFQYATVGTIAIEATPNGVLAIGSSPTTIIRLTADGPLPLTDAPLPILDGALANLGEREDVIAVSPDGQIVLVTNLSKATIVEVDLTANDVSVYQLPTEFVDANCPQAESAPCETRAEVGINVESLTVASNGDVYFSDHRKGIGVVHSRQ